MGLEAGARTHNPLTISSFVSLSFFTMNSSFFCFCLLGLPRISILIILCDWESEASGKGTGIWPRKGWKIELCCRQIATTHNNNNNNKGKTSERHHKKRVHTVSLHSLGLCRSHCAPWGTIMVFFFGFVISLQIQQTKKRKNLEIFAEMTGRC